MHYFFAAALFIAVAVLSHEARAQADMPLPPHVTTTVSPSARYEIVQSELAAKWTFRLDRVCGRVYQLIHTTGDDELGWGVIAAERRAACQEDGRTHYQLFTSSLAAKFQFLMNSDTGATWVLTERKRSNGDVDYIFLPLDFDHK
jgi:hypothetical protein